MDNEENLIPQETPLDVLLKRVQAVEDRIAGVSDTATLQTTFNDLKTSLTELIKSEKIQNQVVRNELETRIKVLQDEIRNVGGELLRRAQGRPLQQVPPTSAPTSTKSKTPLTLLELD